MENPSSQLILVQVVLLSDYPNPEAILQLLKSGFHTQWSENELNSAEAKPKSFHLANLTSVETVSNRKNIKETIGVNPDSNSVTLLMPSGSRKKVSISFTPKDDSSLVSTILLIRNNLTIIDAVFIQGQGGNGVLKIGNQLPGSKSVLSFELLEKHLKSCSKSKSQTSSTTSSYSIEPTFTVHRTFTAVNVGKLSMKIKGFAIGPQTGGNTFTCQGYGFKVINCGGFDLRPNENRKIHIAFTPDFTQFKTKQMLTIMTDNPNEKIQYALIATLPKHLLPSCNNSLPRPNWEAVLYYCLVTMMTFMILLAVCVAFFDGDRILNFSFYPVLTTYAVTSFESTNSTNTPEDVSDKLFPKLNSNNNNSDDFKDSKRNTELRNRKFKPKCSRSNSNNTKEDINNESNSMYQNQSWTQFLKKKFVRRDSSGSDKSNNSLRNSLQKSQSLQQMNSENVRKELLNNDKSNDKSSSKSKLKKSQKSEIETNNKNSKKRLNYPKQENLTNVISSPPPPLPIFPNAFDEESFFKNLKSNKKSRANSFNNDSSLPSLELPYKPKTNSLSNAINNNNPIKSSKKFKNKEEIVLDDNESYHSSNENSIIWDSPINTFDSGLFLMDFQLFFNTFSINFQYIFN